MPFVAALLVLSADTAVPAAATTPCTPHWASEAYTASVQRAVNSGIDLWGNQLLAQKDGPTLASAQKFLTPLLYATQRLQRPLTPSGFYYVPLSFGYSSYGPAVFALHVADGSQIITRHIGGPSMTFYVGNGRERYGTCTSRLQAAQLADGYLPIVQTSYTDAEGVKYHQESFVGRAYSAQSVVSYVKLDIDASTARAGATVRVVPWKLLAHSAPDRLAYKGNARLIASDGAQFVGGVVRYHVARGDTQTVYLEWLNRPSAADALHADATSYASARAAVVNYWTARLSAGMTIDVPEPAVKNAELGILAQALAYGWRYSVGNAYEELSFAEALDSAEVDAEYGYPSVAKAILQVALTRLKQNPKRFTAFRAGHVLSTTALYYRITRDHTFIQEETPELSRLVSMLKARQIRSGPAKGHLQPEQISVDIPYSVDSVNGTIAAWQGLLAMDRVWSVTGYRSTAARARDLGLSIQYAMRTALKKVTRRLSDGSIFVPDALKAPKTGPYPALTKIREGSYWNLVMPYALASGWFKPHSRVAHGLVHYVLAHGSRLLGVTRADAHIIYSNKPYGSGLGEVYGLSMSRFMADNDHPDQLVLSLYGMIAIGMTPGTFISGEAISVIPVNGAYYRSMYMPPNSGANASYLETLRQMLVHEVRGASGAPTGLDLAFSTPRPWLESGKSIDVENAETSFGKVSYSIARTGARIAVQLTVPPGAHTRIRLRVPKGERVAHVSAGVLHPGGTIDLGTRHGAIVLSAVVTR
ncbi:MAG TPA: hypothetical protein VGQ38_03430 [Gaiellaceae bacterium]|nr:hypothetical protein [Gaiellaceae bacterium]